MQIMNGSEENVNDIHAVCRGGAGGGGGGSKIILLYNCDAKNPNPQKEHT